ncbi:MAG: hypothetical protein ACOYNO_03715 [Saprospiraceae bacterium]
MKGKLPDQKQASLFEPNLHQIVNPAHELVLLAEKIEGYQINVLLASAAWNMKKFMKKLSEAFSFPLFRPLWQFLVHLTRQSQAFGTLSGHANPAFLMDIGR